jgi:pimeloyl-ACP methyl ester carboxylesterase
MIVQLLGSNDSEVSREDLQDTEQFPNARHLTVPGATHIHLYDLNATCEPNVHYALIRDAFVKEDPPGEAKSPKLPVSKVVFLLHGIRATAHGWPRQLEAEIKRQDATVTVLRPSTGYFTALRFAVPAMHRRALRWFQDAYGQLVASYPTAEFNFVGHSNGTYLMGQTLERIPSVKFNRVFLGGCVLPQDYPWRQRFGARQVAKVVNAFTETDSVVGLLCNALRGVGRKDVGTAGYESFTQADAGLSDYQCSGRGHGAAFDSPSKLEQIAQFVLGGQMPPSADSVTKPFPRALVQAAKFSSIAIAAFLLLIFLNFSWFIGLIIVISAMLAIAFFLSII